MNAFMQCKKIVDTPFPFPYAQCVMVALIMFMVSFPLQMCEVINDDFAAPVVSFFGVCVVVVVNRVATELEVSAAAATMQRLSRYAYFYLRVNANCCCRCNCRRPHRRTMRAGAFHGRLQRSAAS